jgi:hypothetical protein
VGCYSNRTGWRCDHLSEHLRLRHDEPLVPDPQRDFERKLDSATIVGKFAVDMSVVSKRKSEKQKQDIPKHLKGKSFKIKVSNYYSNKGFSVRHSVSNRYGEFDLIATKEEGTFRKKRFTLLIECKKYEKGTIPLREFVKFVRKFVRYYDHYEPIQGGEWKGVFAYVGRLDKEIRPYWKSIPDKDWVRLQPFRK